MEISTTIKELATALVEFQKEVEAVKKDGTNPFYKSTYATFQNVIETIREPLAKNGLSFSQAPDGDGLCTILMHTSGEFIKATGKMTPKDNTPQGQGSAITYMRRYALSAILGIATEDDDDGNAAQPKEANEYKAPKYIGKNEASKAQVKKSSYDEARVKIEKETDKIILADWKQKIEGSAKYAEGEKFLLITLI